MSSIDWMPELAAALDKLVPVDDGSRADWDDVVSRVGKRRTRRLGLRRPRRGLRLAIVIAVLFLLLAGVATATYLLVRGHGGIALGERGKLLVVNPHGPGPRAIASCTHTSTSNPCEIAEQSWSPDGKRIAFVRGRLGPSTDTSGNLWVADADGGGAKRLASCGDCGFMFEGGGLGWSPNGSSVVFSRNTGPHGQETLWLVAAAGGRPHRLTDCPGSCTDFRPAWSPNGRLIAFNRWRTTPRLFGMFTVRPDGSGLRLIARVGDGPAWSPNGRRIAFALRDSLAVVNADGSHPHVLRAGPRGSGPGFPSWSPDGRKLVFLSTPGSPGHYVAEVWTINADGSGAKRLYRSACCVESYAPPIWSPNGRQIAFSAYPPGGTFEVNADGTGLRRISPTDSLSLSWQPRTKATRK